MDYTRLISVLENPPAVKYPVVLPDFFVDHFVVYDQLNSLIEGLKNLAEQGGGNLLENEQFIRRGGNAVNTASALLSLGISPKLIVTTDQYGASLLKALADPELDLSHVHTDGQLSSTVSIETQYMGRKVNLMVSDSGSASDFAYSNLTQDDLEVIQNSGLVALVNLNHNRRGPNLAYDLFTMIRASSKATTFMDMGDPSGNPKVIAELVRRVIRPGLVDILGLNENEVGWVVQLLREEVGHKKITSEHPQDWLENAKTIVDETGVCIDLHTPHYSATIDKKRTIVFPSFSVEGRVVCGAGDAWNAGDIYGTLLGLPKEDRLILANAVAALYVSSKDASHPSISEVIGFLRSAPALSVDGTKLLKVQ